MKLTEYVQRLADQAEKIKHLDEEVAQQRADIDYLAMETGRAAVGKWITAEEYEEIVGEPYNK